MTRRQIVALLLSISIYSLYAVNINDVSEALDLTGQSGVELVSFSKRVYNVTYDNEWEEYDYVYDANEEPTYKDTDNTGWVVQSSDKEHSKYSTYPIKGSSCLRSGLPTELKKGSDAQEARLVFRVYGPGRFSFFYKTSCDESDQLVVYVDGELSFFSESGYGENSEYNWSYQVDDQTGEEIEVENHAEINLDGGKATSGPYEDTFYHEIVIVFEKDLPRTDWDGNYLPDGPEKPDKSWYEDDDDGYKEALADYNAQMKLFFNSVWIDWVQWTPLAITLELNDIKEPLYDEDGEIMYDADGNVMYKEILDEEGNYLDEAKIVLSSDAPDVGYSVRYTLDGSDPTSSSTEFNYEEDTYLTLTQSCTLKAAIFVGEIIDTTVGIVSKEVTIKATAPSLEQDAEHSTDTAFVFKATNQYADNIIVYTMDGTEPMEKSTVYDAETGIVIENTCTVKARCVREGVLASEVVSKTVERLPAPIYRLLDADGVEEPNGVTTGSELTLEADNSSGTLKYGTSETDITEDFPDDGLLVGIGKTYYLRNVEDGKLSSLIVCVQVKKADTTIVFGEGDYALELGWNLVSFPIDMTSTSSQALLKKWTFFGYNSDVRCYQHMTTIKPGCGYWVFRKTADETGGVELNGCVATETATGGAGWNLLGLVKGQDSFGSNEVWSFSNGAFCPLKSDEKPSQWKGYMVRFQ